MKKVLKAALALALVVTFISAGFTSVYAANVRTFANSPKFMEWNSPNDGIVFVTSFEGEDINPEDGSAKTAPAFDENNKYGNDSMRVDNFWKDKIPYGFQICNDVKYDEADIFTCSWSWPGKASLGFTDKDDSKETGIRSRFLKATEGATYKTTTVLATETDIDNAPMTIKLAFEFWDDDLNYLGEASTSYTRKSKDAYYDGYASIQATAPENTAYMSLLVSSPKGSKGLVFLIDAIYVFDTTCAISRDDALKSPSMPSDADDKLEKEWLANHTFTGETDISALGEGAVVENVTTVTNVTATTTTTTMQTVTTTTASNTSTASTSRTTAKNRDITTTKKADTAAKDEEGSNVGIIIGIIAAVVVAAAVVAVIIVKKKKKGAVPADSKPAGDKPEDGNKVEEKPEANTYEDQKTQEDNK